MKGVMFGVLLLALALLPFVLPFLGELPDAPVLGSALFAALFLATGIVEALLSLPFNQQQGTGEEG